MADEENEEEQKPQEAPKRSPMMFIVIGVVVLLLIVIIVAILLLLGGEETQESITKRKQQAAKEVSAAKLGPVFAEMQQFIVNLADSSGRRYLKTQMQLELSNKGVIEEVTNKLPLIRDVIIRILSSKTYESISTEAGKAKLKEELMGSINAKLIDGEVANIFFTKFVVQ